LFYRCRTNAQISFYKVPDFLWINSHKLDKLFPRFAGTHLRVASFPWLFRIVFAQIPNSTDIIIMAWWHQLFKFKTKLYLRTKMYEVAKPAAKLCQVPLCSTYFLYYLLPSPLSLLWYFRSIISYLIFRFSYFLGRHALTHNARAESSSNGIWNRVLINTLFGR